MYKKDFVVPFAFFMVVQLLLSVYDYYGEDSIKYTFAGLSFVGYYFYYNLIKNYNYNFAPALLFQVLRDILFCFAVSKQDPDEDETNHIHYEINLSYYLWAICQILMMFSLAISTYSFNYFFTAFYC